MIILTHDVNEVITMSIIKFSISLGRFLDLVQTDVGVLTSAT